MKTKWMEWVLFSRWDYLLKLVCVGYGLGMASTAGAQVLPPPPAERPQVDENGVDVRTQALQYAQTLLSIGPDDHRGLNHTYYSSGTSRHNFSGYATNEFTEGSYSSKVVLGNRTECFTCGVVGEGRGEGSFFSGEATYITKDGTQTSFATPLWDYTDPFVYYRTITTLPTFIEYPDGVRVDFYYRFATDPNGNYIVRLQSVTSNTGWQLKYYYHSDDFSQGQAVWLNWRKVVAINNAVEHCDPQADSCSLSNSWPFAESTFGNPTVLTDARGAQTQFTGGFNPQTINIKTASSPSANRSYTLSSNTDPSLGGQLMTKVTAASIDGRSLSYVASYSNQNQTVTITASGPAGNRIYRSNYGNPVITSFTDAANQTTQFPGSARYSRVKSVIYPEGNSNSYVYDDDPTDNASGTNFARGNITHITHSPKPGSGLAQTHEHWVYPPCNFSSNFRTCNKPSSYTDARNKTWDYTYYDAHGGIDTVTAPPDSSGRRKVTSYFYSQRYAGVKNSSGSYQQAATPVWLLMQERTCLTNPSCGSGSADEVLISYEYGPNSGPNNLLLRGRVVTHNGESRRTCFSYDKFGNKISETLPRAGLTSCS